MPSVWNALSAPLSGDLLAIQSGSPAEVLTLGGIVRRAEVIETFGDSSIVPTGQARFGEPLIGDGVTIWLEGFFPTGEDGFPVAQDRADILSAWETLRTKLLSSDFQFFLHYEPGAEPVYRQYQSVNTVLLRSHWADPIGFQYQLAAITTDRTLSAAEPIEDL